MNPFCDYLSVSQPSSNNSALVARDILNDSGMIAVEDYGAHHYRYSHIGTKGSVLVKPRGQVVLISASGAALTHLRAHGMFNEWLAMLSEGPHKVTRLDAALDTPDDAPDVLDVIRGSLESGSFALSRKAQKVTWLTEERAQDGRQTGTCYFGHRRNNSGGITARVYDKALESNLDHPLTRTEVTFGRTAGATIRDAQDPSGLFWSCAHRFPHLTPPNPLPNRHDVETGFHLDRITVEPIDRLLRVVQDGGTLSDIARIASQVPGGISKAERMISDYLAHNCKSQLREVH